jgi:hypothetical protein
VRKRFSGRFGVREILVFQQKEWVFNLGEVREGKFILCPEMLGKHWDEGLL